jgi:hypothetical protein
VIEVWQKKYGVMPSSEEVDDTVTNMMMKADRNDDGVL